MGRYRLGDIIRMTRKSLSITQEQLCDGICSVETLSRMEAGKQNPNKDTYELLMERMGRIRERAYSMLSVTDFQVLEKIKKFEEYLRIYDIHQAELILQDIKKRLGKSIIDKQFLIRAEGIINYRLNRINADEFIQELEKALLLTIPQFGTISLSYWPLNYSESWILLNMSTAYAEKNEINKAIQILEETNYALNQSYMDEQQRINIQVTLVVNISKWYGLIGNHEMAIDVANSGLVICKKYRLGNALPYLLYNVAWNYEKLVDIGALSPEYNVKCQNYLTKAYFIASAMQNTIVVQFIEEHITDYYSSSIGKSII